MIVPRCRPLALNNRRSMPVLSRRSLLKGSSLVALAGMVPSAIAKTDVAGARRIKSLIAAMTLEEKAGQLSLFNDPVRPGGIVVNPGSATQSMEALKQRVIKGQLTGLFNGIGVEMAQDLQRAAVEQSRLKIPLIFAMDVIHGLHTIFPIPLAEAASFDPALAQRTARAAAIEATARGLHWTFAPMVDVARDQRWGRVAEGSGEDIWLGCRFAEARVKGFQGDDLTDPTSLLACPKHFAAYGAVQGGMDYNTVEIAETTLREVHLPPFQAAFKAGALSTMASFNDVSGVPASGSVHLLTEILRDEWQFPGLVVSDYESEKELIAHGYAADGPDAVVKALTAGCDMSMQSGLYNKHIPELVLSGRLPMAVVDRAVRRVLTVKQALGLFDNPYRSLDLAREKTDVRRPDAVALARESAQRSLVLLRNEGDLLPLARTQSVALIGPGVQDRSDLPGPWTIAPDIKSHVTIEEGFQAAMGAQGRLTTVRGCRYEAALDGGIEAAVTAAQAADVAILVLGETATMSGEAQSRADIVIPAAQMALAEAVIATGKPVVVLLRHGRALALSGAVLKARAIMATWFLGSETGNAIADVIFGNVAPSGRLPVSFPHMTGQQPFYYNHRSTGRPQVSSDRSYKARYREVGNIALYPFGHGLTYSKITYGPAQAAATVVKRGDSLRVSANIQNSGSRAADEVVQLYIHDRVAEITQPVRQLRGVQRVSLQPGETKTVEFELRTQDLAYVHLDLQYRADPGDFDVWIAPSAETGTPIRVTLV